MKEFERSKEMRTGTTKDTKHTKPKETRNRFSRTSCVSWSGNILALAIVGFGCAAEAATGTSAEFKVDLRGLGPWEMRTAAASEAIAYSSAWATNTLSGATAVVKVNPVKREKPKYIAIDLSGGTAATHYPIEYLDEIPGGAWSDEYKTSKLVLRHIPAGSFIMGCRYTDYPGAVNTNLHMVTLTKDFYMGVFEVTQRQWELVMGNRPSAFTNETCYATRPVEQVSYTDIRGGVKGITWPESKDVDEGSFMGRVRTKSGLTGFDLPTEAQWEYSCRAGTITALNSEKNMSGSDQCVEMDEVARYGYNSGFKDKDCKWSVYFSTNTIVVGTAKVGSYQSNMWGLYDMHGNLWELCLDVYDEASIGSVDPVGNELNGMSTRKFRGGSWRDTVNVGFKLSSGRNGPGGYGEMLSQNNIGFRLCLQGGEIPETTAGVELVNISGTGDVAWAPTKAGTYYLTHETQTNGVNGAEVLGAWFTVGGPELTFSPDGELVPGVNVVIGGAGEGWTIHYTTNGNVPTAESPEYTAPITLDDSATICAIAYSSGGMESEEFSATFTLHDALSAVGAVAKPRYPWNGMVDVDCEVKGEAGRDYAITLEARDLDGGTNLPVRTACQADGAMAGNAFLVKPGQCRFTWNADADIAGDCDFANVAVSVKAEGSATVGAKRVIEMTVNGYTGSETLTNVPVLVRLSTAIGGFNYADFAETNGTDLIFCDESESVIYPHEIDEWHTNGESLIWVKLPAMTNGTSFKMAYGNHVSRPSSPVGNPTNMKHAVWRDYAGVWHMNEDFGTAYDSTEHGLDALPSKGTNTLADVNQMVAYENGACGRARVNATDSLMAGNFLIVPAYDALSLNGQFCASVWVRANVEFGWQCLLVRNNNPNSEDNGWVNGRGWGAQLSYGTTTNLFVIGGSNSKILRAVIPDVKASWVKLSFLYNDDMVSCFTNGAFCVSAEIVAAEDNGSPLGIGGWPNGRDGASFNGQYDEIRLRGGSLSADRIKADYDMIKNRNFLRYSAAERGKGSE